MTKKSCHPTMKHSVSNSYSLVTFLHFLYKCNIYVHHIYIYTSLSLTYYCLYRDKLGSPHEKEPLLVRKYLTETSNTVPLTWCLSLELRSRKGVGIVRKQLHLISHDDMSFHTATQVARWCSREAGCWARGEAASRLALWPPDSRSFLPSHCCAAHPASEHVWCALYL